jgi:hypothetical protein
MSKRSPAQVVQIQLDAYNAKDIDGLLATYAPDAEQYILHGALLAKGADQMRARFLERFKEPHLHAKLISRSVLGNFVIDLELITRDFPEGIGQLEMLCVYEVFDGQIKKASFATGQRQF